MAKIKHLTKKRFDNACNQIFHIQCGLSGLGSLFEFQSVEACFSNEEFFGMGQVIKQLARELSIQEDILRCGYDSRAVNEKKSKFNKKGQTT